MLSVLRQKNFALLWTGGAVSLLGDWVLFVALPFYVYSLTGSALATGTMFIVQTLPRLLLSSPAGVFVDRWNRKYTMFVTELAQAFVLLPLLLVHSREWIWIVYLFAFTESTLSQFFIPAKSAIIPNLVGEDHLMVANSLNSLSEQMTRLVGPALGGVLLGLVGVNVVVLVDVASFVYSALSIMLITLPSTIVKGDEQVADTRTRLIAIWREWLAGLRLVKEERVVTSIFAVVGVAMIAEGITLVLIVPFVKIILHGNALTLGWILSAQPLGGLISALLIGRASKLLQPRLLIAFSAFILGTFFLVLVNIPLLPVVLVLIALIGLFAIGMFVSIQTLLQVSVADEYRGRIFGAFMMIMAATTLVGMALASLLADSIGIVPMMDAAASCYILAGIIAFIMIHGTAKPIVANETKSPEQPVEIA
jgi:MFS family permease